MPFMIQHMLFKNGSLGLASIKRASDSGIYKCSATNGLGQHTVANVKVEVMGNIFETINYLALRTSLLGRT